MEFKANSVISAQTIVNFLVIILTAATALGAEDSTRLKSKFKCQTEGVVLKHGAESLLRDNEKSAEFTFDSRIDENHNVIVGNFDYMIWPRKSWGSLQRSITILKKNEKGVISEWKTLEFGDDKNEVKTVELPVRLIGETKLVKCDIQIETFLSSDSAE